MPHNYDSARFWTGPDRLCNGNMPDLGEVAKRRKTGEGEKVTKQGALNRMKRIHPE
jgi:hypothetical protein